MEIKNRLYIDRLKSSGVDPLYTIWIVHQVSDDGTFDIQVWDEIENDRVEDLEEGLIGTLEEAEEMLKSIVSVNGDITFIRLETVIN